MKQKKEHGDEIDLIAITKSLWSQRKLIVKTCIVFFILGMVIALLIKRDFSAKSVFVPQSNKSSGSSSGLGGLASLAGISIGDGGFDSDLSPVIYSRIINSIKAKKEILKAPLSGVVSDTTVTFEQYYNEYYRPGVLKILEQYTLELPSLLSRKLQGSPNLTNEQLHEYSTVSSEEHELFKMINEQLLLSLNEVEGTVTISFAMPSPIHSAEMTDFVTQLLQKEVIRFRIQKAKTLLDYNEKLFLDKKSEFEAIQLKLSQFKDKNLNLSSEIARDELKKIQTEYDLTFSVFLEIAKQLEEAKLRVKEDTPIFSIIQEVSIPNKPNPPRRLMIPVLSVLIGFFVCLAYLVSKEFLKTLSKKWHSI